MIPYLLLSAPLRKRVQRLVVEYTKNDAVSMAVQAVIEEYGDDEKSLRKVLLAAEKEVPAPGLATAIFSAMEGISTSTLDWRRVPRQPKNKRRI